MPRRIQDSRKFLVQGKSTLFVHDLSIKDRSKVKELKQGIKKAVFEDEPTLKKVLFRTIKRDDRTDIYHSRIRD